MLRLNVKSSLSVVILVLLATSTRDLLPSAHGQRQKNQEEAASREQPIEIRYARAHLALAELELRQALQSNAQVPKVLSQALIDKLKRHVAIARQQLEWRLEGEDIKLHDTFVYSVETAARNAKAETKRRRAIHEKTLSPTTAMELERAEAVEKVAVLQIEMTRARKSSESDYYRLDWQLWDLQHQVLELQHQIVELQQRVEILKNP